MVEIFLGWLVAVPLAVIVPKKKNLVCFIGRDKGLFLDNVKHMYCHAVQQTDGVQSYFLTQDSKTYCKLKKENLPVVYHPSLRSLWLLLRTNVVIVDNLLWISHMKYMLLIMAKKIQLWHGSPLKQIELGNEKEIRRNKLIIRKIYNVLVGRFPEYDLMHSTSSFYTNQVYAKAIRSKQVIECGYPRNDVMFRDCNNLDLIEADRNLYKRISELHASGIKIIIYAPTFRDTDWHATGKEALNLVMLDRFLGDKGLFAILKYHPLVKLNKDETYNHLVVFDNTKDIYPYFPLTDLMITDYSSIFIDYLLLDRPVLFFPYDYEDYLAKDRKLMFDYDDFTPGPKCKTQEELFSNIRNMNQIRDDYKTLRDKILQITFDNNRGVASPIIWNKISQTYLQSSRAKL